jgi:hypothetical protein
MNELSQRITEWLQSVLTPEKCETAINYINDNLSKVAETFTSFIGIGNGQVFKFLSDQLNAPMPDVWNETTGKALEQFLRSMGG